MSLSPRCYAFSQISSLVTNITKKNYKASCIEIVKVGSWNEVPAIFPN